MSSDRIPFRAGQALGRYELLVPVAKGGMGQVWAGRLRGARGFQKLVAVKTLLVARGDDERMEQMLFEEARISSLIQHSNVVHTIELGEYRGALYLVMEWVDGEPMSYLLKACEPTGGVPLQIAVNLIAQMLRGLQAAHELRDPNGCLLGVVHRDVSPHNVLVTFSGIAKLVDFGIAKAMNQESSCTTTGEIKGKFAYMSPEQILSGEVDQRADLFAAGIMLYLLTCGRHPFKNHDSAGVLHSISSDEPAARPSLVKSGYSRTLEAVVLKALEKRREDRWSSADEMRLALQEAVPEAFGAAAEAQLRAFMTETLGERAALKQEALRRAEATTDARATQSGAHSLGATAQSASSLRAVSVDTSSEGEDPGHISVLPTEPPPGEPIAASGKTRFRPAALVALAGCALLAGFALVQRRSTEQRAGAQRATQGEELAPQLAASAPHPLSQASASATASASTASTAASASALPLASAAPPALAKDPGQGSASLRPPSSKRKLPHARPLPATPIGTTDLIAPDYAR